MFTGQRSKWFLVEWSVKFNFNNDIIVRVPLLEGETGNNNNEHLQPMSTPDEQNITILENAQPPDSEGRGK